jgi:hypothetical protein
MNPSPVTALVVSNKGDVDIPVLVGALSNHVISFICVIESDKGLTKSTWEDCTRDYPALEQKLSDDVPNHSEVQHITGQRSKVDDGQVFIVGSRADRRHYPAHILSVRHIHPLECCRDEGARIYPLERHVDVKWAVGVDVEVAALNLLGVIFWERRGRGEVGRGS